MQIRNQPSFWSGVLFVVVGAVFAVGSTRYSMGSSARPGAGYFPLILSVLLAVLGVVVVAQSLGRRGGDDRFGGVAWRPLVIVVAAIAGFGFLLPRAGLVITIPALIAAVSFAADDFEWKGVVLGALVLTAGSWVIFSWGLGLQLPILPAFVAG